MVVSNKYSSVGFACALAMASTLQAQEAGTVAGHVKSASGQPQAGASVAAAGITRTAITATDGSYTLKLPAGRYEIAARAIGYRAAIDSVTIVADERVTKDFVNRKVEHEPGNCRDCRVARSGTHSVVCTRTN